MTFFKFRKGADDPAGVSAPTPSVEVIRQRAKYRLVGATVLVLVGVIFLPLLLDSQPRPIAVNTPIEIPDKNKMRPLVSPATAALPGSSTGKTAASVAEIMSDAAPVANLAGNLDKNSAAAIIQSTMTASKIVAVETIKPALNAPAATALVRASESARVQALLNATGSKVAPANTMEAKAADATATTTKTDADKSADPAAAEGRFVVQVGAFADVARAHEVRLKLESAGMKTYTHIAETKEGRRIRVRVGPFSKRAEAERSAEKVKKLSLPAALLTL